MEGSDAGSWEYLVSQGNTPPAFGSAHLSDVEFSDYEYLSHVTSTPF